MISGRLRSLSFLQAWIPQHSDASIQMAFSLAIMGSQMTLIETVHGHHRLASPISCYCLSQTGSAVGETAARVGTGPDDQSARLKIWGFFSLPSGQLET